MTNQPLPQIRMKRPNLKGLPEIPAIAAEYELKVAEEGDAESIAALMSIAFEDTGWNRERVLSELINHPNCKPTFVVLYGSVAVATATLLFEPEKHPGAGVLHWVASDPKHRGKQLGLIVSLSVLHAAREAGCSYSLLLTDDARIPAIKTYLKLGYEQDCWHESHESRWHEILKITG